MLIFFPANIEEQVYMVSVSPMETGHKVYIVEKEIGIMSLWILGPAGIIPEIRSDFTYPFTLTREVINTLNAFIADHFEEFMAEA